MRMIMMTTTILLFYFRFLDRLGSLACSRSELILNYTFYRQLVRLLGRGISPLERPLPTQDNTSTEYTHTDIPDSSGIRTLDPNIWENEFISCLRPRGHCDWLFSLFPFGTVSEIMNVIDSWYECLNTWSDCRKARLTLLRKWTTGSCAWLCTIEERGNVYKILVGRPFGKEWYGISRKIQVKNIKIDLR
jgi:hypothetical protein